MSNINNSAICYNVKSAFKITFARIILLSIQIYDTLHSSVVDESSDKNTQFTAGD